jgi:uncharacterized protein
MRPLALVPAPTVDPGIDEPEWKWNPDAKLVKTVNGLVCITNFSNGKTLRLESHPGSLVASVSGITVPFRLPKGLSASLCEDLIRYEFIIPSAEYSSYEDIIRVRLAAAMRNSNGLIIMPTEKCNFRCTYCYESFEKGRMTAASVEALGKAIDRIGRRANQFSLSFFGGEPLLCADLVVRLSTQAFSLMRERNLPYAASIATNGALLNAELFDQLLDCGVVSYQITVDGPADIHDRQRVLASGKGTFDTIVNNLRLMAASRDSFACVLRCNAQTRDYPRILEMFEVGELSFVRADPRFIVDIHTIWKSDRLGVEPRQETGCLSELTTCLDYYMINRKLSEQGIATIPYDRVSGILGKACYAGKPNWFVVGPDLSLYKCTVVFDHEANKIGWIGDDGTLHIDQAKNLVWTGSNALTDSGCGSCYYRVPCGGIACPLTRFTLGSKACPEIRYPVELQRWAEAMPVRSS